MWFTETPWPPITILCVAAVGFFLGWLSQRRNGWLAGACLCLALCGIVMMVEEQIVTERERVEQRLLDFARTFQRESMQPVVANLLPGGAAADTLTFIAPMAKDVQAMAWAALQMVDVQDDVRISDVRTTLSNENSRAVTHFRASATVAVTGFGAGGRQSTRWELTWQREKQSGQWTIVRAQRLNFLTAQPMNDPFSSRE